MANRRQSFGVKVVFGVGLAAIGFTGCGSGDARIVSQAQRPAPAPAPACDGSTTLKTALEQSNGATVAFSAPLQEMTVFPAIQKAIVTVVRPCDAVYTQLLIDNQVNPGMTASGYSQLLNTMRAFNGSVDSLQWSKIEWNPLSPVTVTGTLSCAPGVAGAAAQEAIEEDTYNRLFSVSLSSGFLDAAKVAVGKRGYCTLESFGVTGVPVVYSCNRLDFACPNNGGSPTQFWPPGFGPGGVPNEQPGTEPSPVPTPTPTPIVDSPFRRLAEHFEAGRPTVGSDYPTGKELQCAYSGKCSGKRFTGLSAPVRGSMDWAGVPSSAFEPVFHAPLTVVTRLGKPAQGPLIPAIPEESSVRESVVRVTSASTLSGDPEPGFDFATALARLSRMPGAQDRVLPENPFFQIVDPKKKVIASFRDETATLIDGCDLKTPLAPGETIAVDLPEGRTGSVGGTSVLVNRCRRFHDGMIFERVRVYDSSDTLLDTQYRYFWTRPQGFDLLRN